MGTAVTFKPEVVHVIEPRLAGRARLMANMAVNSIATDIEVDATITSTEVGQIARIYERLLIILDEPTLTEVIVNTETIEFLSCSELIFETTGMQHTMPVHIIIGLLNSTHEISHVDEDPENFLWLCHLADPSAREMAALIWRGKRHPKSWLHAKPRNAAFSPSK